MPPSWMRRTMPEQLLDDGRGQAQGQLVDHEQLRLGDERHAESQHLLLAAREVAGHLVDPLAEPGEDVEHLLVGGSEVVGVVAVEPAGGTEVLGHGEGGEHRLASGHLDHPERGGLRPLGVGDVAPVEVDGAADGVDGAADGLEQGGLAGPVGAQEGDAPPPAARPCPHRRAPGPGRRPPPHRGTPAGRSRRPAGRRAAPGPPTASGQRRRCRRPRTERPWCRRSQPAPPAPTAGRWPPGSRRCRPGCRR